MATTQTRNSTPSIDGVFERAGETQEQFADAARKVGKAYLDSYEKTVDRATELQLKLAADDPAGLDQEHRRDPGRARP